MSTLRFAAKLPALSREDAKKLAEFRQALTSSVDAAMRRETQIREGLATWLLMGVPVGRC